MSYYLGYSSIPLTGLCHQVSLARLVTANYYGVEEEVDRTVLQTSVRCRITTFNTDDHDAMRFVHGRDTEKIYKILFPVVPDVRETDLIINQSRQVARPGVYEIFYVKDQIDEFGRLHHMKLFVEMISDNVLWPVQG